MQMLKLTSSSRPTSAPHVSAPGLMEGSTRWMGLDLHSPFPACYGKPRKSRLQEDKKILTFF